MDVMIVGAGIGGLTLALCLHRRGIPCRIYESAPAIRPIGAGVNLLPHAVAAYAELGLADALERRAVVTAESVFYNRFGQLIYQEPAGRFAGFSFPQLSIHRADLHEALLDAVRARIGGDRVHLDWRCTGVGQTADAAIAHFDSVETGAARAPQRGAVLIGCDGIHSVVRKALHPEEGPPLYSGVNMWRGVTPWPRFLSGASMVRAGWLATGKMVIYPIRDAIDEGGRQLVNWVAELETPRHRQRDWNRPGELDDFIGAFADWRFDWLDVPALIRSTASILEFPMVDQDPLERWSFGRITLLGDAAHPMYPRGSNGAVQAILDAGGLATRLAGQRDWVEALEAYDRQRRTATTGVVLANRANPPDAILREVYLRSGDKPFRRIEDIIARDELARISSSYRQVSGYAKA
jgi:2-polyprenyl-6-methoxyphenol hydroxylase-like FAD-dependent oxidoreductase